MPQKKISGNLPTVTTWGDATPVLVVAVVFDLLRIVCTWLWVFAPGILAVYCVEKIHSALLCGTAGTVVGAAAAGPLMAVGALLSTAVGLMGWIFVALVLFLRSPKVFERSLMQLGLAFILSEVPLLSSIPSLTIAIWRLFRGQIKEDKEALQAYNKKHAAELAKQRQQAQLALLSQARQRQMLMEEQQMMEAEAALEEERAAEIPDEQKQRV